MIGHRSRHNTLLKLIIKGYLDGKTGKERPRMEYMTQIMKDMSSYRNLKELSFNGEA